mmetsp:Transcript_33634/g.101542  ORF Transcript_33634/g.101542 Transcript_33634/m.101542 type:complete len:282 (-) Transcript_33634:42-887(-)
MCCLCFFRGATSASRLARVAVILATTLAYAVQFTATIVRRPKLPRACTRAGVDGRRRGTRVRSKPRLPTPSPPWPPRPTRPCPRRRRPTATPARGRGTSLVRRSWPPRPEERTPNARRPRSGSRGTPPRRATAGRAAARPPTRPTCAVPGRRSKFAKKSLRRAGARHAAHKRKCTSKAPRGSRPATDASAYAGCGDAMGRRSFSHASAGSRPTPARADGGRTLDTARPESGSPDRTPRRTKYLRQDGAAAPAATRTVRGGRGAATRTVRGDPGNRRDADSP